MSLIDQFFSAECTKGSRNILLSDEGFMAWRNPNVEHASPFVSFSNPAVDVVRDGTHPIVEFIRICKKRLPQGSSLKVIITIRNQADFLGSLIAQTGFVRHGLVRDLVRSGDRFMHFSDTVKGLSCVLGEANLLILFLNTDFGKIVKE